MMKLNKEKYLMTQSDIDKLRRKILMSMERIEKILNWCLAFLKLIQNLN